MPMEEAANFRNDLRSAFFIFFSFDCVVAVVENYPERELFPLNKRCNFSAAQGNKTWLIAVYADEVPDQPLAAAGFEELAVPLFDQLYNFAHWLTQERSEAEDLVQETYVKALRGFSGFQPGTN